MKLAPYDMSFTFVKATLQVKAKDGVIKNIPLKIAAPSYVTDIVIIDPAVEPVGTQTVITPEDVTLQRKVEAYIASSCQGYIDRLYTKLYSDAYCAGDIKPTDAVKQILDHYPCDDTCT